jgi:hypothetical protein
MPFPLMVFVRSFAATVGLTAQIIVLFDRLKPGAHQNLASLPDFARARSLLQTLTAITGHTAVSNLLRQAAPVGRY